MALRAIIARHTDDWVILIVEDDDITAVLTMGTEDTFALADAWGKAAILAEGWLPGRRDPLDAHDRARLTI